MGAALCHQQNVVTKSQAKKWSGRHWNSKQFGVFFVLHAAVYSCTLTAVTVSHQLPKQTNKTLASMADKDGNISLDQFFASLKAR